MKICTGHEPAHLSTLFHLIGDASRKLDEAGFTLPEIGTGVEKLMGNAYRCHYTTRSFRQKYDAYKGKHTFMRSLSLPFRMQNRSSSRASRLSLAPTASHPARQLSGGDEPVEEPDFDYPFNDLMLWAVLTRRHDMAKCIWEHGEEPMAKALVAIRLYKCMSKEAADDYTEVEVSNQLREYAEDFRQCSFELLNHCYQQDETMTMRLLTAELPNWGHQTCLSLAVTSNTKRFLAHPCCQILLAELWHGGLRFRSQSNAKVLLAVLFPPTIFWLHFKTPPQKCKSREQMYAEDEGEEEQDGDQDRHQKGSMISLHLTSLFRTRTTSLTDRLFGRPPPKRASFAGDERHDLIPESDVPPRKVQILSSKAVSTERVSMTGADQCCADSDTKTFRTTLSSWWSNLVLFYGAPITSFWIWSISFLAFMFLLIYVLLIESPSEPTFIEWFLFAYVVGLGMEHFRKLLILESSSLLEKVRVFYNRYWNMLTTVAVVTYFIGFGFRMNTDTIHTYGRVILASNSVLWHMKLFDFL
ncbi:cation channel family protein, partial [Aphelenchoides avenae]